MNQPNVMAAAFNIQLSSADIFQALMPVLGMGAVLLFLVVVCGIYGLCRGERKSRAT